MRASNLALLEQLQTTEYAPAVHWLIDRVEQEAMDELAYAEIGKVAKLQGTVSACRNMRKMLMDARLLRSLLDNANEHPVVIDKE